MARRRAGVLPDGARPIAVNLVAAAATTYGFLALSARALGPEAYAPLAVLWSAVFLVVPTIWGPLEQETGRLVAGRRVRGDGAAPVLRAAAIAGLALGAPVVLVVVGTAGWSGRTLFSGSTGVAVALGVAVVAFGANHLLRAAVAGVGAFWAYGACISVDSAARLAAAVGLAIAGVESPVPFALALAVAPLLPVAVIRRRGSAVEPGPAVSPMQVLRAVAPLAGGQLGAQILINGGPVAVAALAVDDEQAVAGRFLAALVIARVPLFFFQAIQGALLPSLAAHRAAGERHAFGRLAGRLLGALVAVTIVATAGAAAAGPTVVRVAFGADFALGGRDLAMLALGSGLFMVATVTAHGVVALDGHRSVAFGWSAGVVAAGSALAIASDLLWRVELAFVAGVALAAVVHGWQLVRRWRVWHPPERPESGVDLHVS